jgi:mono/diheme cytochrome c family protein
MHHDGQAEGRRIFAASCASCHTTTGHDTQAPGGDLAVAHLTAAQVASFARVMPVRPALSRESILAVAAYVATAEERNRR